MADVGGGTGPYSFWLAEQGHYVSLFDLMPHHIDQALSVNEGSPYPLNRIEEADLRSLELPSQSFDVVLLLGPMYHLTDSEERASALQKVSEWLSPDGVGFVAYISRFASAYDGFLSGVFDDPEFLEIVREDLETGVLRPSRDGTKYFTHSYFHHPIEIEREAEAASLRIVENVAVEGMAWLWQNLDELWGDDTQRDILLEMVRRTDRDRSLLGASCHLILVVRKRDFK